ncbi:MAG: preprotein translocase subunit SecG [Candidatus Nealsonbacteria bacterium]
MNNIILIAQLTTAVLLIVLILIQQRGTALGSAFGQGSSFYGTLRGVQKKIFWATVVTGIIFIALSVANLIL